MDDAKGGAGPAAPRPRWREVWQAPVLGAAGVLLAGGLIAAVMTAPKPDLNVDLRTAASEIEAKRFGVALETLNAKVLPRLAKDVLTPEQRREFHLLRARALYLGQRELNLDRADNNRAIASEYEEAERRHATLTESDVYFLASTRVSLGELDAAVVTAAALPESSRTRRIELYKRIVEGAMRSTAADQTRALDLLTNLTADAALDDDTRLWVLARQTELLVRQGYAEEAINKVVRTLPRIEDPPSEPLGEMLVNLARAYMAVGEPGMAADRLARAGELLGPEHPMMGDVTLLLADLSHDEGRLAEARTRYGEVIGRYAFSEDLPSATLGLAEVNAKLSNGQGTPGADGEAGGSDAAALLDESIERYAEVVAEVRERGGREAAGGGVTVERVEASLLARHREQMEKERPDFRRALRFATLAESLTGRDATSPATLLAMADSHRRLAEETLLVAGAGGPLSLADADPATRREARQHLLAAGECYRDHAARTVQTDAGAYAESLWTAALAFDRAGDLDASVAAFQDFSKDMPGDARQGEARFRLAEAYRARGDLELAAAIYRDLIGGRGTGSGGRDAGIFGDASHVPLAQTLLADADAANDAEARTLLEGVASGMLGGTGTEVFRGALRELAQMHYQAGEYERAIERFEEVLRRSEGGEGADHGRAGEAILAVTRYKLADSYRLSAAAIARSLEGAAFPDGERRALELTRDERLGKAAPLYESARRSLEGEKHRTALQDLYLRNSYLYLGDCAFDLRDYETAVRRYEAARERYPKDPASLVALAQVVNALLAQGELAKASAANARARRFYESLPDSVWGDPTLPMTRRDWERWLASQAVLARPGTGAAGTGGTGLKPASGGDAASPRDSGHAGAAEPPGR